MRTLFFWLLLPAVAAAAEAKLPSMDELRAPSSPAFALAGIAPTNIERPGSAKAFGISLLNVARENKGTGVPRNLAVEFSPYWWVDHPDLTFDRYYEERRGLPAILQTFSISAATYETEDKATKVKSTGVGMGAFFDVIRGEANPKLQGKRKELVEVLGRMAAAGGPRGTGEPSAEDINKRSSLTTEITNLDKNRVGLQVSLAAAITYKYKDNDLDDRQQDRTGAWVTVSYKPRSQDLFGQLTFLGMARYSKEKGNATTPGTTIHDYGGRLLWRAPDHPFTLSAEYIRRDAATRSHRLVALGEYKVTEDWCIFISHGKTFDNDFAGGDLVSIAGLSLLWGNGPQIK